MAERECNGQGREKNGKEPLRISRLHCLFLAAQPPSPRIGLVHNNIPPATQARVFCTACTFNITGHFGKTLIRAIYHDTKVLRTWSLF